MSSKQFDSSGDIVLPALKGLCRSSPWLSLIESERVVYRTASGANSGNEPKVTIVAGGGSGHEPTHAGFVGDGLIDAAVAGTIFASPSTKQIYAGLKAVESPKGSLIIAKNYTGDVIHFGLAAERAKAQGGKNEVIIVQDDVAVGRTQGGLVGRRALAGTVLVHKIAGAAAAKGLELGQVADIARSVVGNLVTIAASLDHCNVPGRQFETNLKADEFEIGMGIHNEPGIKKASPIPSIPQLVSELLPMLLSQEDSDRAFVPFNKTDDVVLLINNLGGVSNLELSYAAEVTTEQLREKYGVVPKRTVVGTYITALNGPGFSITLLNASRAGSNVLELFDAPAKATGWNHGTTTASDWAPVEKGEIPTTAGPETIKHETPSGVKANSELISAMLTAGVQSVMKEEPRITKYDTVAGDGDCGETLNDGGNAILKALKEGSIRLSDGVNGIADIADLVEDSMGGTSGGLYCIFLSALAKGVRDTGSSTLDEKTIASASKAALESLFNYTKARKGDRTLVDALQPFVETLNAGKGFPAAVKAAVDGADSTRKLEAKFGRASYVSKDELKQFDNEGGLPDPGAIGLGALLSGLLSAYEA
jgi:dihydroxyacetone kinase